MTGFSSYGFVCIMHLEKTWSGCLGAAALMLLSQSGVFLLLYFLFFEAFLELFPHSTNSGYKQ